MVDLAKHAAPMPRRVTILGSTGSVGCSTLDLIARNPEAYRVTALTANSNVNGLVDQALKFRPEIAAIANEDHFWELKERLSGTEIHVAAGPNGLVEAASANADWVMGAIVGAAGLHPTLTAIRRGAIVALANKECLVCAGDLVMSEVTKCGATLLPVDSEHNAIFQVFDFARPETVRRIILTASGGPFRKMSRAEMTEVTADQAVAHPNWDMGAKISVDSATMMNKGLERIEAYHLFPVAPEQIEILVHPQSVIHSMVDYVDGSTLAQLGTPDMRTPIAYTLGWPKRIPAPAEPLDLASIGNLQFEAPDETRFPALRLAREALSAGGAAPTILNAANEIAVDAFLRGKIGFLQMFDLVEMTLESMPRPAANSIEEITAIDDEARRSARNSLNGFS